MPPRLSTQRFRAGLLAAGACLALSAPAAHAADIVIAPALPEMQPEAIWSGFYVGASVGTGAVNHDAELLGIAGFDGLGGEGFFGEVTVGYDHLLQNGLLLGAAVNARYGNIGPTLDGGFDLVETDTILSFIFGDNFDAQGTLDGEVVSDYGFDVIGRVGVLATPQSLFYVLGGYSWQHFDASIAVSGTADILPPGPAITVPIDLSADTDWSSSGFVVGAGIETALTDRVHLKTEYRYSRYQSEDLGLPGIVEITPSFHTVNMGLNYRFGTPQPVMTASSVDNFDWTGVYVTAAGGAQALVHDVQTDYVFDDVGNNHLDTINIGVNGIGAEGILGEIGAGADFEFGGGFVVGAQASARWANTRTRANIGPFFADINADFSYDVIGRAGYKTAPNTLVYALGGWSRQEFNVEFNDTEVFDEKVDGFVVGGGIETALTDRIVAGFEYRYAQYEQNYALPDLIGPGADVNLGFDPSFHSGRATLKFKLF